MKTKKNTKGGGGGGEMTKVTPILSNDEDVGGEMRNNSQIKNKSQRTALEEEHSRSLKNWES